MTAQGYFTGVRVGNSDVGEFGCEVSAAGGAAGVAPASAASVVGVSIQCTFEGGPSLSGGLPGATAGVDGTFAVPFAASHEVCWTGYASIVDLVTGVSGKIATSGCTLFNDETGGVGSSEIVF